MEKEISVRGRTFKVREMLAVEMDSIDFGDTKETKSAALKKQVMISTGISESDYNSLTVFERLSILNAVNEVNGLGEIQDFQKKSA